ncbi:transcriptional regulator [Microbacterium phage vB_MoxS-R1]|uniref:Transcriptional regulator n=1 Tax=Microbacterium phage vB_MoxS-R1 TaxID=2848881 RepID=A0A8F2IVH0_9CAUD|nr:XRE family transcriptional regulator [Microbacterium sp. R1]YP_010649953.1 transcriptional regulator [Microbacterium phage vB_MoxS-R1]QWT28923.1 transcriptional regulator [Microbacterium phage vB_MoxS-R1]
MERYLSRAEFAERIGVLTGTLSRYKLPEPDAMIGSTRGWTAETIDTWNAARPRKGGRAVEDPNLS